jgi:hypothetical protein
MNSVFPPLLNVFAKADAGYSWRLENGARCFVHPVFMLRVKQSLANKDARDWRSTVIVDEHAAKLVDFAIANRTGSGENGGIGKENVRVETEVITRTMWSASISQNLA